MFIELTLTNGDKFLIDRDDIALVFPRHPSGCTVERRLDSKQLDVMETYRQVKSKIKR